MFATWMALHLLQGCGDESALPDDTASAVGEGPAEFTPPSLHFQAMEQDCDDGVDNDLDGLVDCEDSDCLADDDCIEDCDDGVDNDLDGLVDCEDGDCLADDDCIEDCTDGIDNDLDGLVDMADDDCHGDIGEVRLRVLGAASLNLVTRDRASYEYWMSGPGWRRSTSQLDLSLDSVWGSARFFDQVAASWHTCSWAVAHVDFGWEHHVGYRSSSCDIYDSWDSTVVHGVTRSGVTSGTGCSFPLSWVLPAQLLTTGEWNWGVGLRPSTLSAPRWYVANLDSSPYLHYSTDVYHRLGSPYSSLGGVFWRRTQSTGYYGSLVSGDTWIRTFP